MLKTLGVLPTDREVADQVLRRLPRTAMWHCSIFVTGAETAARQFGNYGEPSSVSPTKLYATDCMMQVCAADDLCEDCP